MLKRDMACTSSILFYNDAKFFPKWLSQFTLLPAVGKKKILLVIIFVKAYYNKM